MNGHRKQASAAIALCLVGLAACGGGSGEPGCGLLIHVDCPTEFNGWTAVYADIFPRQQTVQVGGTATFSVGAANVVNPVFDWRRSSDGGKTFARIPDAKAATYTLAGVQLADDGAQFFVDVFKDGAWVARAGLARLAVSSMPAVVFQDSEFDSAHWTADATPVPPPVVAIHTSEQAFTGGNPTAFRQMTYTLPSGPSFLRVFNTSMTTGYDPATQGAIYLVDFAEDCRVATASASIRYVNSDLLIEQAGRRYTSKEATACGQSAWSGARKSALGVADLALVDGPPCAVGESCPDFSAAGAPLRFGYLRDAAVASGQPGGAIVHGIDNWKVTVWRR